MQSIGTFMWTIYPRSGGSITSVVFDRGEEGDKNGISFRGGMQSVCNGTLSMQSQSQNQAKARTFLVPACQTAPPPPDEGQQFSLLEGGNFQMILPREYYMVGGSHPGGGVLFGCLGRLPVGKFFRNFWALNFRLNLIKIHYRCNLFASELCNLYISLHFRSGNCRNHVTFAQKV